MNAITLDLFEKLIDLIPTEQRLDAVKRSVTGQNHFSRNGSRCGQRRRYSGIAVACCQSSSLEGQ
jgi:hypothetical protein